MVAVSVGIDATRVESVHIPQKTPFVYGYCSGTSDIQWTTDDFHRFPGSQIVRIWQGYGAWMVPSGYDECDMERGALNPTDVPRILTERVSNGFQWTTFYGSRDYLAQVSHYGSQMPRDQWVGHANCRLADWNLNEAEASTLVGTLVEGMTCVAVQWASDTSNPNTMVPGGTTTLGQTPMDLNVVQRGWQPSRNFPVGTQPPPALVQYGVLVTGLLPAGLVQRPVVSHDNGGTWS